MAPFDRDVQEMTPADEVVYEAVVEADAWKHAPTTAELGRSLPLGHDELDAAIAHLTDTTGFLEPVRRRKGEIGYRPVPGPRAPPAT